MCRPLRLVSLLLIAVLALLATANGDQSGNGGIVVLPCAVTPERTPGLPRAVFEFGLHEDIVMRMPTNVNSPLVLVASQTGTVGTGSLIGNVLTFTAEDLAPLEAAAIASFDVYLLDIPVALHLKFAYTSGQGWVVSVF